MKKNFLQNDLSDKTIVFTGGTDGMGKVAASKLANMGAQLLLLGRNKMKSMEVVSAMNLSSGKKNVQFVQCDLSSQKSIRKAADTILEQCPKIDLLINCAGMNAGERRITEDGMEMSWAVNHLSSFLLNNLLLTRLKETGNARIVNLSSATEKSGHIYLHDIQLAKNWSTFKSYTQAKLAMNMCTRKLAKELEGSGVTVNALNPGFIKTNLLRSLTGWEKYLGVPYMFFFASKPEVGADRILRVALSDEYNGVSGKFVYEDAVRAPNPEALDNALVDKVWELSLKQVGL